MERISRPLIGWLVEQLPKKKEMRFHASMGPTRRCWKCFSSCWRWRRRCSSSICWWTVRRSSSLRAARCRSASSSRRSAASSFSNDDYDAHLALQIATSNAGKLILRFKVNHVPLAFSLVRSRFNGPHGVLMDPVSPSFSRLPNIFWDRPSL